MKLAEDCSRTRDKRVNRKTQPSSLQSLHSKSNPLHAQWCSRSCERSEFRQLSCSEHKKAHTSSVKGFESFQEPSLDKQARQKTITKKETEAKFQCYRSAHDSVPSLPIQLCAFQQFVPSLESWREGTLRLKRIPQSQKGVTKTGQRNDLNSLESSIQRVDSQSVTRAKRGTLHGSTANLLEKALSCQQSGIKNKKLCFLEF